MQSAVQGPEKWKVEVAWGHREDAWQEWSVGSVAVEVVVAAAAAEHQTADLAAGLVGSCAALARSLVYYVWRDKRRSELICF